VRALPLSTPCVGAGTLKCSARLPRSGGPASAGAWTYAHIHSRKKSPGCPWCKTSTKHFSEANLHVNARVCHRYLQQLEKKSPRVVKNWSSIDEASRALKVSYPFVDEFRLFSGSFRWTALPCSFGGGIDSVGFVSHYLLASLLMSSSGSSPPTQVPLFQIRSAVDGRKKSTLGFRWRLAPYSELALHDAGPLVSASDAGNTARGATTAAA